MTSAALLVGLVAAPGACGSSALIPGGGPGSGGAGTFPLVLAMAGSGPFSMAVDATDVYWTNCGDGVSPNGSIMKVSKTGGVAATLVSGLVCPESIVVDGANVYWSTIGGAVTQMPIAGGTPIVLASPPASGLVVATGAVAVDAANVYFGGSCCVTALGTVMTVPIGGGPATTLELGQGDPRAIAVDGTSVYWVNLPNFGVGPNTNMGSVMKAPLSGGVPVPLAAGQNSSYAIALDSANVFWGTGDGNVMKLPKSGGIPTLLAACQGSCPVVAVEGGRVYSPIWRADPNFVSEGDGPAPPGNGFIMSVSTEGGTPTVVPTGPQEIGAFAVDATSVYFIANDAVETMARP